MLGCLIRKAGGSGLRERFSFQHSLREPRYYLPLADIALGPFVMPAFYDGAASYDLGYRVCLAGCVICILAIFPLTKRIYGIRKTHVVGSGGHYGVFFTEDHCRIYYEVHGSGEQAIVFVNGGSCSYRYWYKQLPLAEKYRLVFADLRGHGDDGGRIKGLIYDEMSVKPAVGADGVNLADWGSLSESNCLPYLYSLLDTGAGGALHMEFAEEFNRTVDAFIQGNDLPASEPCVR